MKEETSLKEEAPAGGDWTEQEIQAFTRRADRFKKAGMTELDAEQLAQRMLYRDRPESGDDRRICLECKCFSKGLCKSAARSMQPMWNILQRCDGFAIRGVS